MSQEEINLSDYSIKETLDRGTVIVLRRPVEVMLKGKVYVIPTGFESDGLSVPKRFWKVIAPPLNKQTLSSAVCHDFLYTYHLCTRLYADWLFFCNLINHGFPIIKAVVTFLAVRIGGGSHWN